MEITGRTRVYAVLGHPVSHSLSPVMHNAAFAALGLDAVYVAFDVTPEHLAPTLQTFERLGVGGLNLTVPLKEHAVRLVSRLAESAQMMGAVNTIEFTSSGTVGHNTDGWGFLRAAEEAFGAPVAGRSLFIIGCGGAGRAVAIASASAGVTRFALMDVERARALKLAMELETQMFVSEARVVESASEAVSVAREFEVLVQATPLGLKPTDPSPLPAEAFGSRHWAFDLVYGAHETAFVRAARAAGARATDGLGMLLHQGAKAFEIWTHKTPPLDVMRNALARKVYGR